jgi:hypothetical protein
MNLEFVIMIIAAVPLARSPDRAWPSFLPMLPPWFITHVPYVAKGQERAFKE